MPDNTDAFLESLVANLKPVSPLRQGKGMAITTTTLVMGVILVVALIGLRRDFAAGHPDPLVLTAAWMFLVLALASAWGAVDMARPAVGIRREGWYWAALIAVILPVSALVLLTEDGTAGLTLGLDRDGWSCLALGTSVGLLTGGALLMWLRRGAPTSPSKAGLLTGIAAGAAGIFAVSLGCPHNSLMHIGFWHGATVVVSGLMGRLLLPRLLRW